MPTSAKFQVADLKTGGNLENLLREWRSWGCSYRDISARLREWDVDITETTVWRWVQRLEGDA